MFEIVYSSKINKDIAKHQKAGNKKILSKLEVIIEEIRIDPRDGTGKPERLKYYDGQEIYSRRLDGKHRLIYEIIEDKITILLISAYGHYD